VAVPTFGSASADAEFSGSTTFTVTAPASVATGDGLIALVLNHGGFFGSVADLTPPSPWVTVAEIIIGNSPVAGIYTLIAPSASPSFAWTMNDGGERVGAICRVEAGTFDVDAPIWTGLGATAGVDYTLTFDGSAGTGVDAITLTPPYDECLGVAMFAAKTPFGGFTSTTGGWTNRVRFDNDSASGSLSTKDLTTSATGTVTETADVSVAANEGVGAQVAVPALGTVVLPPVSRVAVGAKSAGGTTTVSIAYPTGLAAGDQIFAFRVGWESDIVMSNETGWTSLGGLAGGTGTAADNHTTEIRGDSKDTVAGTESGSVTFDQTGGTTPGCLGIMVAYQLDDPTDTWDIATSTGDDATHGANRSITASTNTALAVDDVVVVAVAVDTDTSLTITSPAITASGITFGPTTRLTSGAGVGTGDDGNIELFEAKVTAGTGTVALALAFTTTTNQCGPALFVRLRAVAGGPVENFKTVTGSVTGTGRVVRASAKTRGGSSTGTGVVRRLTGKRVAGTSTPTGALTRAKTQFRTLAGTVTATRRVVRSSTKRLLGSSTATGAAIRRTAKTLQGSSTASGTLAASLLRMLTLAGTVTPAGVIRRATTKRLAGTSTPAGRAVRHTTKGLAGSVVPAGDPRLTIAKAFAGTITATGRVARGSMKRLAGSITATGRVVRAAFKTVGGSITPTGGVDFGTVFLLTIGGTITATGRVVRATGKRLAGSTAAAGLVRRSTFKRLAGQVTPTGVVVRSLTFMLTLAGSITPTGLVRRATAKRTGGTIATLGVVGRAVFKRLAGTITGTGTLTTTGGAPNVIGDVVLSTRVANDADLTTRPAASATLATMRAATVDLTARRAP